MRRPLTLVLAAVTLALAVGGCQRAQQASPGETSAGSVAVALTVDAKQRSYRLYVPLHRSAAPLPLVVMMHGGFGTAEQAERAYGWDELAQRQGFAVAYPDGLNRAWSVGGGCCGAPGAAGQDDVAFIEAVVTDASTRVAVDRRRIFATGMSNGAMMTYRLACDSDAFAAIAPVAGTLLGECAAPRQVSVLHIHGLADTNVPFDGSKGTGVAKIDGPPVTSVIDLWRDTDRCDAPAVMVDGDVTRSTSECADGRGIELITIAGAGHQWPGAGPPRLGQQLLGADPPSTALDATATIWEFFLAHPSPA